MGRLVGKLVDQRHTFIVYNNTRLWLGVISRLMANGADGRVVVGLGRYSKPPLFTFMIDLQKFPWENKECEEFFLEGLRFLVNEETVKGTGAVDYFFSNAAYVMSKVGVQDILMDILHMLHRYATDKDM